VKFLVIHEIRDIVIKHNMEERSFKGFWKYFENYRNVYKDEFEKDFPKFNSNKMELFIDTVSFRITNWPEEGYNHIVFAIRMHYNEEYAGHYTIVFSIDGEIEDDYLSFA